MTQEVQLEKDSVVLDTEISYSGAENPGDEEKPVRKAAKQPAVIFVKVSGFYSYLPQKEI